MLRDLELSAMIASVLALMLRVKRKQNINLSAVVPDCCDTSVSHWVRVGARQTADV